MIRKLRIALANWIMPGPQPPSGRKYIFNMGNVYELRFDDVASGFFREIHKWRDGESDKIILSAVKTFPGGLTVIDKKS